MQAGNTVPYRSLILLGICGVLLFIGFVALGNWQVKRLYWKRALIDRVAQRVHAPIVNAPGQAQWNKITAESDEYRHVRVNGVFLDDLVMQVGASTLLGRGFWVMTPLRQANGNIILINRGFIPYGARPCASAHGVADVTGVLRISEPGGTLLRSNNPTLGQWYSRDILAMAANKKLSNVAPFFIDAQAGRSSDDTGFSQEANCIYPAAGLTVIAFPDNHLAYALTWYTMGLMVAAAVFFLGRAELRLRRSAKFQRGN